VITVHDNDELTTYMFTLPPEAIPLLLELLSGDQRRRLMTRTPAQTA
jgi:hypothetical protein